MAGALLLAALTGAGTAAVLETAPASVTAGTAPQAQVIINSQDSGNPVTAAAAKASPSVVTISATAGSNGGTGSGIILDTTGHILTNTHVVTLDGQTATPALEVRTGDGRVYPATVTGTDPLSDLAVIQIRATGLVPASLSDSSKINTGDRAIAIGAPLGLAGTVTEGIVSARTRTISIASSAVPATPNSGSSHNGGGFSFAPPNGSQPTPTAQGNISINVVQTDAAINPGNSGGPLLNTQGQVIGINVAIASATGGSSSGNQSGSIGVGFAIPVNNAKRVARDLITTGTATHGQLGVSVAPKTASANSQFSIGARIGAVTAGSPAERAGLRPGDTITGLNERTIQDAGDLTAAVREQPAGTRVTVTYQHAAHQHQTTLTLGTAPKP